MPFFIKKEKKMGNTKKITLAGLFLALGVLLPQIAHLSFGMAMGNTLLPMHIPVLLAGFFTGPIYGGIIGAVTPIISSLLTGMPPVPRLYFMIFELFAYGFFSGLFYKKLRLNSVLSLVLAMISGRLVYFVSVFCALDVFGVKIKGFQSPVAAVVSAVTTGIAGIIIQLILIPAIVEVINRAPITTIKKAKRALKKENASAVLINKEQNITETSHLKGIKPILEWLKDERGILNGAFVADKIVGKAAAMLMVKGGVKKVYAEVLSRPGAKILKCAKIPYSYGKLVDKIINRDGTDICPMEKTVEGIDDIEKAYEALIEKTKEMA